MNRNSIIEKIKALLSKTTANGCTEAEMFAALAKAQAMQDAYQIDDDDVREAKEEAASLHTEAPETDDPHLIKWHLSYGVAQFCNVTIYRPRGGRALAIVGSKSDQEQALWLFGVLADFVFEELYKHLVISQPPPSEKKTVMRVFVEACCGRITDRLVELVKQSEEHRTSNGRELVVVKNAAIKAYLKEHDIHIHLRCTGGGGNSNEAAAAAGHAAGGRASFGRPVSGAGGVLRLK